MDIIEAVIATKLDAAAAAKLSYDDLERLAPIWAVRMSHIIPGIHVPGLYPTGLSVETATGRYTIGCIGNIADMVRAHKQLGQLASGKAVTKYEDGKLKHIPWNRFVEL